MHCVYVTTGVPVMCNIRIVHIACEYAFSRLYSRVGIYFTHFYLCTICRKSQCLNKQQQQQFTSTKMLTQDDNVVFFCCSLHSKWKQFTGRKLWPLLSLFSHIFCERVCVYVGKGWENMTAIKGFYSFTIIYDAEVLLLVLLAVNYYWLLFFLLYFGVIALLNWYVVEWNLSELKC